MCVMTEIENVPRGDLTRLMSELWGVLAIEAALIIIGLLVVVTVAV